MPGQKITPDDVCHVARLARLSLSDAEVARFVPQLESILEYVAMMDKLDVSSVEPMAHALPLVNVLREDVVTPSLPVEKVLQNAPETDGPFFRVPKVIGGDEEN